jgi:hypothetical protein
MALSLDPVKKGKQMAFLKMKDKKTITGLDAETKVERKKIQVKLNRTLNTMDKSIIDDGENVLNNLELIDPPENFTIKRHFDTQPTVIQEALAKTFGRNKKLMNKLIQKRLNEGKNNWVYSLPIPYQNENGKKLTEDSFNFSFFAVKDKITIALINPKKFVKLANDKTEPTRESKRTTQLTSSFIRAGRPIPTPRLELNHDGDQVIKTEGIDRVRGAIDEGIDEIPVYIITKEPIDKIPRLQAMKLANLDFKKV